MQTATKIELTITKNKFDNTLSGTRLPIEESVSIMNLVKNPLKFAVA
jgi:hypothetical protein